MPTSAGANPGVSCQLLGSQARAAQLVERSPYPHHKGRLDSADAVQSQQASAGAAPPGKTTPSFGPVPASVASGQLGLASFSFGGKQYYPNAEGKRPPAPADAATDGESRTAGVPLVCDDELLGVGVGRAISESESDSGSSDSSSCSSSSSGTSLTRSSVPSEATSQVTSQATAPTAKLKPQPVAPPASLKPKPEASLVSTESSAGSGCSTPRSIDTESMPWQECHRSSAASSSSGAPGAWRMPVQDTKSLGQDGELEAEVRQLLLQYKLDNERARPEVGLSQVRQPKESSGPELSSKSAWIQPDKPAAQQA